MMTPEICRLGVAHPANLYTIYTVYIAKIYRPGARGRAALQS